MILRLRINILNPPGGVTLRMQRGRDELVDPSKVSKGAVTFDFEVRVGTRAGGRPNFLGEFTQGPPAARFVYVNAGTAAGQPGSPWSRRAKIPLIEIPRTLIDKASGSGGVITADIEGTGRDGGPSCATVPLVGDGWRLEPR